MSRAIGDKMPAGFNISSAKSHLSKTSGLGPQPADAVLLIAIIMEPVKHLGSEAVGKVWLERVSISLSSGGGGSSAGSPLTGLILYMTQPKWASRPQSKHESRTRRSLHA